MKPLRFGTDGWRAVIAEEFTFANVERVAAAVAGVWNEDRKRSEPSLDTVVVGFDRRFLSDAFARRAAETLVDHEFRVILTDRPTPTPAVSWAVARSKRRIGGLVVTASHNPPEFNGLKLKANHGGPATTEFTRRVEQRLAQPIEPAPARTSKEHARRTSLKVADLWTPYLDQVGGSVDLPLIRRSGLKVAHDAMHGVGAGCFEQLLKGGRSRVTTLRSAQDPWFGGVNPEPIAKNCGSTSAWLRLHPQDVCLVSDGDADRLGLMGGRGEFLTTHDAIVLVLHHLARNRGERGRVVTTPNTTARVLKLCATLGLPVTEVPIGFKHLGAEMVKGDTLVAVEESGSIGIGWHLPERDGILAGLLILEMLAQSGMTLGRHLARLEKELGPHHYGRLDLKVSEEVRDRLSAFATAHAPERLAGTRVVEVQTLDGVKYLGADGSWLMVRTSGTEPIVRVYAEAPTTARLDRMLGLGRRLVGEAAKAL